MSIFNVKNWHAYVCQISTYVKFHNDGSCSEIEEPSLGEEASNATTFKVEEQASDGETTSAKPSEVDDDQAPDEAMSEDQDWIPTAMI